MDAQNTPEWFTKDLLENVLRRKFMDNELQIVKLVVLDFGKGVNYISLMKRVEIQFTTSSEGLKSGHYLLKSCFDKDIFSYNLLKEYNVYAHEMRMYDEILPKLTEIIKTTDDADSYSMFPETIAVFHEHGSILFEDLTKKDFVMEDRLKGLNLHQTKMLLKKLSRMHAASVVLKEKEFSIFDNCDKGLFNRHTRGLAPFFETNTRICGEIVSKWSGYEEIGKKILALVPKVMEYGERVYDPEPDFLNVLNHGDLWVNNLLFKYSHGSAAVYDCMLIDFQFSSWGSPAIDLFFLFSTSLQKDVRGKFDELIQYYFLEISYTLKKLKFFGKVPTLMEFRRQLALKSWNRFIISVSPQAVILNPDTEDADFQGLVKTDEKGMKFKKHIQSNPVLQENLRISLPVFDKMGLLDLQ